MSILNHKPPRIPDGGRAYVAHDGDVWRVSVEMPSGEVRHLSPPFGLQTTAYAWLDWVTGVVPTFTYPEGRA